MTSFITLLRCVNVFNFVLLIKTLEVFFNKSASLIAFINYYQNYFDSHKGAIALFYIYFFIYEVSVNTRNINTIILNGDSATLKVLKNKSNKLRTKPYWMN